MHTIDNHNLVQDENQNQMEGSEMSDSYKVKYQQLKEDHPRAFSPKVLLPTRFFLISVIVIFTKISEST